MRDCQSSAQGSPVDAVGWCWCPGPCLGMRTAGRPSPPAQPSRPAPPHPPSVEPPQPGCRPLPGWKRRGAQLWPPSVPTHPDSPQGAPLSALWAGPQHPVVSLLQPRPVDPLTGLRASARGAPGRGGQAGFKVSVLTGAPSLAQRAVDCGAVGRPAVPQLCACCIPAVRLLYTC